MRKFLLSLMLAVGTATAARFDLTTPGKVVRVADPQISPDGKQAVISVSRANFNDNRWDAELVLIQLDTKAQRVLTPGRRGVSSPRWSPDGTDLAFLASVEGKPQVFVLNMTGPGESRQITKTATGVQHFAWRPDGKAIAFAAMEEEPKKEGEERHNRVFEVQYNDYLRQDAPRASHVWIATLDGKMKRITSGEWTLPISYPPGPAASPLSWSADGKSLAIVKITSPYSGEFDKATVQILDVETGSMRALTGRQRNETQPAFSPDGTKVAYWYPRDGKNGNNNDLQISPIGGGEGVAITRPLDRNIMKGIWMPDSKSLLIGANDHTATGVWLQPLEGAARKIDFGKLTVGASYGLDISVAKNGRMVLLASESQRPTELYVMPSIDAKPERITDFNAHIAGLELGRMETITWNFEGYSADGVVTYPPDFQAGRKYPLVLYIHGGPSGASKETFSARAQLFAAQGWIVFEPNYRGSDNLGNTYKAAIGNDAGAGPGRDVMAGLDVLRKRGIVDESRMAVSGWSYGGYMTTWMIGNYPGLWRAAVAGAAVTDMVHQFDLGDSNVRRGASFGGSPYTDPKRLQAFIDQSPITYIPKAKTPTLILALTGDYRVPITQSYRLYHALRENNVPVKFFAYPLPGHNAADPVHQRDIDRRWVEWLKQYLDGSGAASGIN
jgi:dipeptidyl aminopeptidase/acylaminoacyl peptidase